ncbi:Zn-dependent protease [Kineosphaera limosa]|nr:site-2 protease family protein [Kineosphaera limosa]NYE03207.1 Zn-dependent protease [Kineosphaera limosa]
MSSTQPTPTAHADDGSGSGWRVGSLRGIPVYIGGGWVVIALFMVAVFGPQIARTLPGLGVWAYVLALGYAALLLVSVLVHEAAHALTALGCGYRVHRIAADLMGGHTAYDAARATPGRSALVAFAGPMANFALCLLGWQMLPYVRGDVLGLLIAAVAWTNGFVALFNLLPGLPLDGGFLLDALVWRITGQRHLGLIAAGWSGRIVTLAVVFWFAVRPLLEGSYPSLFTIAWIALIGAFLWFGAGQAITTGRLRGRLARLDVRTVTHPVVTMARSAPLTDIPRVPAELAQRGVVVAIVDDDGTPLGILDGEAVGEAVKSGYEHAAAESCLRLMPPAWVLDLSERSADLSSAIDALVEHRLPLLLLREPGGAPWGALDGGTVSDIATGAKKAP